MNCTLTIADVSHSGDFANFSFGHLISRQKQKEAIRSRGKSLGLLKARYRATHSGGRPFSSLIQLRDRRHCVVPVDVRKTSVGTFRLVASFYGREKNKGTRGKFSRDRNDKRKKIKGKEKETRRKRGKMTRTFKNASHVRCWFVRARSRRWRISETARA